MVLSLSQFSRLLADWTNYGWEGESGGVETSSMHLNLSNFAALVDERPFSSSIEVNNF